MSRTTLSGVSLNQRIAQAEMQLARLRNEAATRNRREDTARKILLGAFLMEWSSKNGGLPAGFDTWLKRPRDRKLFSLPIGD